MGGPASRDIFLSALRHAVPPPSKPNERKVATFQARAERIRELKDELSPLIEQQRGDIWEMREWGWSQRRIAAICGVSQVQVLHVLKGQR